jgi:periplasmic protein TonB
MTAPPVATPSAAAPVAVAVPAADGPPEAEPGRGAPAGAARAAGSATAAGAAGGPPSGASGVLEGPAPSALLTRYLTAARDRIRSHREYPYLARRAQLQGTVCLRVSVAASGGVVDVTPTCGQTPLPLLRAALKAVAEAAPFAPVPPALGRRLTFEVPVVFELADL